MAVFNRTIPLLSTPLTKAKTLNDPVSTPTRHCAVLGHLYQKMAENQTNRGAKLKGRIFADPFVEPVALPPNWRLGSRQNSQPGGLRYEAQPSRLRVRGASQP